MRGVFLSPGAITAQVLGRGVDDYLQRMTAHHNRGQEMSRERTQATGDGVITHYASAQELRATMHEYELAQECEQAMYDCVRYRNRALMSAYRHACYCRVRSSATRKAEQLPRTLAQVTAEHATSAPRRREQNAPPGAPVPVLSTCHASNAPGLTTRSRMETAPI